MKHMQINKTIRDKISTQALQEIQFARTFKQGKITNWQKNEDLYYGNKPKSDESRANVDLGLMQSFVHTLWSKIDNPLIFKFTKRKTSQFTRVKRLNALRAYDAQRDNWDLKDLAGKKQGIMYGRAIYSYYADSLNGYTPHLENVDVYDFLIDPSGGGIDIENCMYMGRYGVIKTKQAIKQGIKDGIYIKTEAEDLIKGEATADDTTQEDINQKNRTYDTKVLNANKEANTQEKFKFWEWYTTFEGTRYYVFMDNSGRAIRVEKLKDIFESDLFPFWTWAAFPDLTEFWTPSYCDYVREIFMAQAVSINQMLDNAEQINKPMKIVDITAIDDLARLKYRKDGNIEVKGNVGNAIKFVETPSISTPLNVFDKLDAIQEKASGVTAASKGIAEEDKVGIYEGNQANAADRFGLLNKSYSFGYHRFAKLFEWGVREHLTKKVGIDILGVDGVELEEISKRDIFWKNDTFGVMVEASNAEISMSEVEKRTQLAFLSSQAQNPIQNPKKAYEIQATIAGFTDEVIRQLTDTQEFGDAELLAEADRDIEMIIDGKTIRPNQHANVAYKQRLVDYMSDNQENLDEETFNRLVSYTALLQPIIESNVGRQLVDERVKMAQQGMGGSLPDQSGQSGDFNLNTEINAEAQL
jgi:hypothetical protein